MSRKTEPRPILPRKKGDCSHCGGTGVTGMYQDPCSECHGSGGANPPESPTNPPTPKDESLKPVGRESAKTRSTGESVTSAREILSRVYKDAADDYGGFIGSYESYKPTIDQQLAALESAIRSGIIGGPAGHTDITCEQTGICECGSNYRNELKAHQHKALQEWINDK